MKYSFTLLLLAAVTTFAAPQRKSPTNVAELFVTAENLEIIRSADKIDACVLRYIAPPKDHSMREERYEETEFVLIADKDASAMRAALLRDSNYDWDSAKGCWPRYHTRLRFHLKEKSVAIDFCFSCEILLIYRDGVAISGEDFEDHVFLETMRKLFPDDVALKKAK
jgi:hypothetical protein